MCVLSNAFGERLGGFIMKKRLMIVERERERGRERERAQTLIFVFPSLAGITQHGFIIIGPSVNCVIKFLPVYTSRKSLDFPF